MSCCSTTCAPDQTSETYVRPRFLVHKEGARTVCLAPRSPGGHLPSLLWYNAGSHKGIIRGSIAPHSDSLSALHGEGHPSPRRTRFRLLAKLCRAGFVKPQGCNERFLSSSLFLLSRALLAQRHPISTALIFGVDRRTLEFHRGMIGTATRGLNRLRPAGRPLRSIGKHAQALTHCKPVVRFLQQNEQDH